mmetsp:Transcript_114909/g.324772  ORF Transcript_114909/g.324772 Transcript_114909/m.324772 type:complete len:200 (-) Transcript_114909:306-905(-)
MVGPSWSHRLRRRSRRRLLRAATRTPVAAPIRVRRKKDPRLPAARRSGTGPGEEGGSASRATGRAALLVSSLFPPRRPGARPATMAAVTEARTRGLAMTLRSGWLHVKPGDSASATILPPLVEATRAMAASMAGVLANTVRRGRLVPPPAPAAAASGRNVRRGMCPHQSRTTLMRTREAHRGTIGPCGASNGPRSEALK